jgi:hypothetical protein
LNKTFGPIIPLAYELEERVMHRSLPIVLDSCLLSAHVTYPFIESPIVTIPRHIAADILGRSTSGMGPFGGPPFRLRL